MGLPDISGPPLPARVLLVIIELELALIANAVSGFASGLYAGVDTKALAGLCAYSLTMPWLIAANHRAKGWRHQPAVPAFGVKTDMLTTAGRGEGAAEGLGVARTDSASGAPKNGASGSGPEVPGGAGAEGSASTSGNGVTDLASGQRQGT